MPDGYSFEALQAGIDQNVRDVPEFTRKLRRVPLDLDHPVWVQGQALRHRAARAPARPAEAGWLQGAHPAGRPAGRPSAGPLPAAVGDVVIEEYVDREGRTWSRSSRRCTTRPSTASRRQPDLAPVLHRAGRAAAGADRDQAFGHEPSRAELLGRGVVTSVTRPLTIPKALVPSVKASRRPSAGPGPARRWRHR